MMQVRERLPGRRHRRTLWVLLVLSLLGSPLHANVVAGWRSQYLAAHFGEAEGGPEISGDARDELAHVNYLAGRIDEAVRQLEAEASGRPRSARALNNLGNAHASTGDFSKAVKAYRRALESDPDDAGIWLNCGLVLHAAGDAAAADEYLAQGLVRSGGYAKACELLGLRPDVSEAKQGSPQVTSARTRRLLRNTLRKIPLLDSLRANGRIPRPAPGNLKPIRLRIGAAGARGENAGEVPDLRSYLYWRERE